MIKNIIFDIGNVLIDYDPRRIINAVFADKAEQELILQEMFLSKGWKQLDQGVLTFDEYYQNLIEHFPQYSKEIKWILENWHKDQPYVPGIFSVVRTIYTTEFNLFILSNASYRYFNYAKSKKKIFQFFKGITISAELKLLKPQKEIYDRFCQIHHIKPEECLFFDDQFENVQGAINAGWEASQFTNTRDLQVYLGEYLGIKF